jgi:hypothetical protein
VTAGTFANAGGLAPATSGRQAATNPAASASALLAALKEELFALETERLEGKLTEADYTQLKGAFEVVLRRALDRQSVGTNAGI